MLNDLQELRDLIQQKSYVGHAGRPGKRGGSLPKGQHSAPQAVAGSGKVVGKELSMDEAFAIHEAAPERDPFHISTDIGYDAVDQNVANNPALAAMLHRQGFDGLPEVVDEKTMNSLVRSAAYLQLFRGVDAAKQCEQFKTGPLFVGTGAFGDGTYAAQSIIEARGYAGHDDAIIRMALRPDAKVIDHQDLLMKSLDLLGPEQQRYEAAMEAYENKPFSEQKPEDKIDRDKAVEHKKKYIKFLGNLSMVAAALGYDAVGIEDKVVILNRTAVVVQKEPAR